MNAHELLEKEPPRIKAAKYLVANATKRVNDELTILLTMLGDPKVLKLKAYAPALYEALLDAQVAALRLYNVNKELQVNGTLI